MTIDEIMGKIAGGRCSRCGGWRSAAALTGGGSPVCDSCLTILKRAGQFVAAFAIVEVEGGGSEPVALPGGMILAPITGEEMAEVDYIDPAGGLGDAASETP